MNLRRLALLAALALAPAAAAQTYIVSYAPVQFPVNTPGATYMISGLFPAPNFTANGTQYAVCFYTGYGASATPIVPTNETYIGNNNYSAMVTVPASSFQVTSGFNPSGINNSGKFYIAPASSTCTGDYNNSLTNQSPLLFALPPTLTSVAPSSVQQPNASFSTIPPPRTLTFTGQYFYDAANGQPTSVVFNWSSSTTSTATVTGVTVPSLTTLVATLPQLPPDVSNLTAQVCHPVGTYTSCSSSLTIPVTALIASSGSVSSSASPASLGTQVNLTATFSSTPPSFEPSAPGPLPTGTVTFTSDNTGSLATIGTAPLVLDPTTAQFVPGNLNQLTLTGPYPALPTVTADLNSDGLADVILYSNAYTGSPAVPAQFTIILGAMPYGSFQTPTTLAVPTNCASVTSYAFGDLNGDGLPDLVLACVPLSPTATDPYETYVLLGNGDGTFQAPYQVPGVTGNLLALADMNRDGALDLVSQGPISGQTNSYGFAVLEGDGEGGLYAPGTNGTYPGATVTTGTTQPGSQLLVVDLNFDGYPDIVELDNNGPNGNTIDIYQNHTFSTISFGGSPAAGVVAPDTYIPLRQSPNTYISLFAADLNKDGQPDLGAATNNSPYGVDYAFNTSSSGSISFAPYQSVNLSTAPSFVAAADYNGDGFPDLLIGGVNTQVLDNDGTGQFGVASGLAVNQNGVSAPVVIATTDLNGDSVADLILGSSTYSTNGQAFTVAGYITSGSATATLPYTFTTGTNANITANWPGSGSVAAPATAPTLSLPLNASAPPPPPTYNISNTSPSYITVGSGDTPVTIYGTLPTFSPSSYLVCFYTGYGASLTPLQATNGDGSATFTAPASSIQSIQASAFSNGTFSAQVYIIAAGSNCTGTPDATLTNTYGLNIAANQATINGLQVPFVPAPNNYLGEGGMPYPSNLLGTGSNFLGTGGTPSSGTTPLTQLYEYADGNGPNTSYGTIFNSGSFAAGFEAYLSPSSSLGIQACDNLGSPCSNTLTLPVHPLETDIGTASFLVLNANTDSFTIPPSGTHQAAAPGFYSDTTAANYSNLTNVSPGTPQATGQYSVSATGLYTFYSGDIGSQISITYDTTTTSTTPTPSNPVALKATFGTASPDVTGAPSGSVNFFDYATYTSYYTSLTLDPTATWVAGGGGTYAGIDKIALRPTIQDFNNDSIPDMLVVDDGGQSGTPSLQLLAGTLPSGTFNAGAYYYVQTVLPNCATIASYAVADFNQDGYPDVAVLCTPVGNGNNTLSVILNNGDGTFNTTPITWYGSIAGSQIVAGDFNGDGNQDIVYSGVVNSYNGNNTIGFQVLDGDGTGNFHLPDFYTQVPLAVGTQLAAADFDGDGYTDLAVLNGDPNNPNIAIYQNTGAQAGDTGIQFTTPPVTIAIPSASSVNSFSIVSLGYGQLPSIIFPVTGTPNPGVYAALSTSNYGDGGPGTVSFAPTVINPVANLANAVFSDINGDGNIDAVVDNGTNMTVLTGDGIGDFNGTSFTALTLPDLNAQTGTPANLLAAVDLNDDGYADIFTYTTGDTNNLHSYITAGTASGVVSPQTFSNGQHNIQANTNGTVQIAPGSATTSFTVTSYTDSLAVSTSGTPSAYGQPVQINATLTAQPTGGPAPTGNVTFYDGNTQIGNTYPLSTSGVASFSYSGFSVGPHNLTAQYTGDSNYPAATSPIFVQSVGQITPILTWPTPAAITYGTALSATQLNAVAKDGNGNTIPGTFSYTPASGAVLGAGNQALSVLFTPQDTTTYSSATLGTSILVNKATPSLTWSPAPVTFTYGSGLTANQLNAAAQFASNSVPGTFTYTYTRTAPTAASGVAMLGTVLSAGTYTLTGTFTPTDTADYTSGAQVTASPITVNQATPIITWATPAPITFGTALSNTQLNATAKDTSGNTIPGVFVYTPQAGTTLPAGNQSLSVTFTPTDTTDYASRTVPNSIQVNKATPVITWNPPAAITYGTALSTTQLNATSPVTGVFTYTPAAGTILGAGMQTLSVAFVPNDTADYNSVPSTGNSILVNKATPAITWNPPAAITYGTALSGTQLNATSPVAGGFTYTPAAGTILGAGNQPLSVTFTPTDTTDYSSTTLGNSILVNKATPSITWNPPAAITYGTPLSTTQLNATSPVPGIFTYTPAAGTVLGAGNQTLSAGFVPTDTTDYNSVPVTTTPLVVNKATPAITWNPPAAITYGTALSTTQLDATSPVAGVFTYNPIAGTILNAGNQTLSVAFVPTDTTDYNSVPLTTTSILVNKATPVITWNAPAAITYGTALSTTQLDATSPVAGVFTYNPIAGTILNAGNQTLSVAFVPTDTTDYNSVPLTTTSLVVNKANPILTYTPTPLALTYGTPLSASQLGATSSDPTGTFAYTYTGTASGTTSPGTVLGVGSYVLKATFTPTDTNYNVASINGGTLVVSQATPALTWATPADIIAGVPLSTTQLNATVGGNLPGTFTYTPAAGTVLSAGNGQTLNVKFTPSDLVDYTTASTSTTINVIPLVIGNVTPGTATLGDPAKPITLTGTGFLTNSIVQANGSALPTNYVNATTLTATIPASDFLTLSPIAITVLDPTQALSTNAFSMPIAAAVPATTFTGPSTVQPGQQPTLNFNMTAAYPVPLTATVTLTFAGTGGVDDPAIQFASGTRTFTFTIPAGSTTVPTLQFQDGTDAGTITATLVLTALNTNVTPAAIQPINVIIPPAPPDITTATLTRSGDTLTVFIVGFSNTRDMTTAQFHFNAAPGATINDPDITIQAPALFTPWFSQTASQAYGSNFGYTQTFNLSTDASSVGSVTITLTNSVGNSITVTAQ